MSSIRTLLVQLDATAAAEPRLRTAWALAAHHGAALTGVFAAEPPAAPMATVVSDEPGELLARADRAAYEHARRLFESMRESMRDSRRGEAAVPMRWREPGPEGGRADLLAEAAYADLLLLGVHDPAVPEGPPAGLAECLLSASGRPALVLPAAARLQPRPRTVLVGWDASPAAVHALAAAQPWLQAAGRVLVLDGSPHAGTGDAPIRAYLQCHRIAAELVPWPQAAESLARPQVSEVPTRPQAAELSARPQSAELSTRPQAAELSTRPQAAGGPGEALLALARREAVDLLVMGCQGHGPLHELLFGGASHTVLQRPPVPLLMAH